MTRAAAIAAYRAAFGEDPQFIVNSPGRVNLIGEHVDYCDGCVLPMAIGLGITLACGSRGDRRIEYVASDLGNLRDGFSCAREPERVGDWRDHVRGVAAVYAREQGDLPALSLAIAGNLPAGSGLSSSAALGVGAARALAHAAGQEMSPRQLAQLAQQAERRFVGTQCGIMDQLACAAGVAGHALLIDCRSLDVAPVRLPEEWSLLVVDSGIRRELAQTGFNHRAQQCADAAQRLGKSSLRDVTGEELAANEAQLNAEQYRLARHVVGEIARVREAAEAIGAGDIAAMGRLINASHASLRDDFRVSLPQIDQLVALQQEALAGQGGARMMGGGFGGCTIALCERERAEHLHDAVERFYRGPDGRRPWMHEVAVADGVAVTAE